MLTSIISASYIPSNKFCDCSRKRYSCLTFVTVSITFGLVSASGLLDVL